MYKTLAGTTAIIMLLLAFTACGTPVTTTLLPSENPGKQPIGNSIDTGFAHMLGFIPYSFLEEYDIWYGDPNTIKNRYGLDEFKSIADTGNLTPEERRNVVSQIGEVPVPYFSNNYFQIASLIGWDGFMVDRAVFHETPLPWGFSVAEGNFEESIIIDKLLQQDYQKAEYGSHSYYWKNEDMEIDILSDVGKQVMAQLNRVALIDNVIITAPATEILTPLLDTMKGGGLSIVDNAAGMAIANSMGDIQGCVLLTPTRLLKVSPGSDAPVFDLPAAENWGMLHKYSLLGIGYRNDRQERDWVISLYFPDKDDAASDAVELKTRLDNYIFNTHLEQAERTPLTSKFAIDEPVVKEYEEGATLTISCRYLPETAGSDSLFTLIIQTRDLLFLVNDASPYLVE
jgi:hypothetical protein